MRCGACCAAFRVDFHVSERGGDGVPDEMCVQVTARIYRMRGTDEAPPRCVALKGKIGIETACAVYFQRPSPCRDFAPWAALGIGDDACARARGRHGLSPLSDAPNVASGKNEGKEQHV
jgi:Fe-S-cluster containining protein